MWYDPELGSPPILMVVLTFQRPQKHMGYQDAFILCYIDNEGIWRSTSHRPIDVLYWCPVNEVTALVSPDTYRYIRGIGWREQ